MELTMRSVFKAKGNGSAVSETAENSVGITLLDAEPGKTYIKIGRAHV